jgi:hypothetical protein
MAVELEDFDNDNYYHKGHEEHKVISLKSTRIAQPDAAGTKLLSKRTVRRGRGEAYEFRIVLCDLRALRVSSIAGSSGQLNDSWLVKTSASHAQEGKQGLTGAMGD